MYILKLDEFAVTGESSQSAGAEQAQTSITDALSALDTELKRWHSGLGEVSNSKQLTFLRRILVEMSDSLRSENLPDRVARRPEIGRTVVDSWPFDSELGRLLLKAEAAYRAA